MKPLNNNMDTSAAAILASQGEPVSPKRLMNSGAVRAAFGGISDMALWRWLQNRELNFPQPLYINKRRFWDADEIEAFQRRMSAASAKTRAA